MKATIKRRVFAWFYPDRPCPECGTAMRSRRAYHNESLLHCLPCMQWYSGQNKHFWLIAGAIWIVALTPITDQLSTQLRILIPAGLTLALIVDGMGLLDRWYELTPVEPAAVEASRNQLQLLKNSDTLLAIGFGAWGYARWQNDAGDAHIWFAIASMFALSTAWRVMISRLSWQDARQ